MATTLSTPHTPRLPLQRLLARLSDRAAANLVRMSAVQAAHEERRRLERDLHDGVQQRLIALRIHLGVAAQTLAHEPAAGPHVLDGLAEEAQAALDDLRRLVHHEPPALLAGEGLAAALRAAVTQAPLPAHLDVAGLARQEPELETGVYFACVEALQNAAKHAGPHARVAIRVCERGGRLCFQVVDSGQGFDASLALAPHAGGGLANMRERIEALGGALEIASDASRGTTISGFVPLPTGRPPA